MGREREEIFEESKTVSRAPSSVKRIDQTLPPNLIPWFPQLTGRSRRPECSGWDTTPPCRDAAVYLPHAQSQLLAIEPAGPQIGQPPYFLFLFYFITFTAAAAAAAAS